MKELRALSLTQPWATLVVTGEKKIETRSWATRFEGVIAIHASKGFPKDDRMLCYDEPFLSSLERHGYAGSDSLPVGKLIGTARVMGCRRTEDIAFQVGDRESEFGNYGPSRFAWMLADFTFFRVLIPCVEHLGLWKVPSEIVERLSL